MQVSVSGLDDSIVWGVSPQHYIYRWTGAMWDNSPTLITVEIILIMVTNFFWLLLVFRDDCKKRKFSENRGRGGPGPPKGVVEKN